jgi:hypothetical protein
VGESLKLELCSFINSVKNKGPVLINGEDGLKTLKVAIACLSSQA